MGCGSALPTSRVRVGTEEEPWLPELVQQAQTGGAPSTHVPPGSGAHGLEQEWAGESTLHPSCRVCSGGLGRCLVLINGASEVV